MRYSERFRVAWSIQWRSSGLVYVVYLFLSSLMWEMQESAIQVRHLIDMGARLSLLRKMAMRFNGDVCPISVKIDAKSKVPGFQKDMPPCSR